MMKSLLLGVKGKVFKQLSLRTIFKNKVAFAVNFVLGWVVAWCPQLLETTVPSNYFNFALGSGLNTHLLSRNYPDLPNFQERVASQVQAPLSTECI